MKTYIICCVSIHNLCLIKMVFLRYGPKCSQPIRLQYFWINKIPEQINEIAWFFACWYQFRKIKFWLTIFWMGIAKNWCDQSGYETLKLNEDRFEWNLKNWIKSLDWKVEQTIFYMMLQIRKTKSCVDEFWVGVAF